MPGTHRPISYAITLALALGLVAADLHAQWPQWRGPDRTGHSENFVAPERWPESLELGWRVEVGRGHASPLVDDDRVYLFLRTGGEDRVEARQLADGALVWHNGYPSPYKPESAALEHGQGPFSTPLLHSTDAGAEILVTYSIAQILTVWRATDGERLWQRDFGNEFDHPYPVYGNSQSPIVSQGVLVIHAGGPGKGAIYGFEPATGKTLWRIAADGTAYGSFLDTEIAGNRQLVGFTEKRLIGLDPTAGKILWEVDYEVPYDNTVVTPTVVDDHVIVAAWQTPMRSYRVTHGDDGAWGAKMAWQNDEIAIQHASPVLVDGRLYGHSHRNGVQFYCVDAASGKTRWLGPPRQKDEQAVLVAAAPWVLVFRQNGRLEVLHAEDDGYAPRATYEVADGQIWAHPAVWGEHLLVKDATELSLWRVPAATSVASR